MQVKVRRTPIKKLYSVIDQATKRVIARAHILVLTDAHFEREGQRRVIVGAYQELGVDDFLAMSGDLVKVDPQNPPQDGEKFRLLMATDNEILGVRDERIGKVCTD